MHNKPLYRSPSDPLCYTSLATVSLRLDVMLATAVVPLADRTVRAVSSDCNSIRHQQPMRFCIMPFGSHEFGIEWLYLTHTLVVSGLTHPAQLPPADSGCQFLGSFAAASSASANCLESSTRSSLIRQARLEHNR